MISYIEAIEATSVYMIDLICDPSVQPFYEILGLRNDDRQSGTQ